MAITSPSASAVVHNIGTTKHCNTQNIKTLGSSCWAYRMGLMAASVRTYTLLNMNIPETSGPIAIKILLETSLSGFHGKIQLPWDYNGNNIISSPKFRLFAFSCQ